MEISMVSKTRSVIENLVREKSFKWLIKNRTMFGEEFEEMGKYPSAGRNWITELSPLANLVVRRCSKMLGITTSEFQENFNAEASDSIKHPSCYARNLLECCCFRALALATQVKGYLNDKKLRRLIFDMMLAWEFPCASSGPIDSFDGVDSIGLEAFSRIASAVPIISNVIISDNLFEVLIGSTGSRLQFSVYEKYLNGLERAIRKLKTQSESSLLSAFRSARGEKVLEVEGTITSQPVLQHVGISTWPGRLVLTDHVLYFEAHRVLSYDTAKRYDLSDDLKQVIKPELTGPLGTRLFDKAVLYNSISLSEPVVMEFPELKGHNRRDYWLAIIREILYVHKFMHKFQITGVERDETLLKAILGILRVQALKEISSSIPLCWESLLMFNLCDKLPGGDLILETLANMSTSRESYRTNNFFTRGGMYSMPSLALASNLGCVFGMRSNVPNETGLVVGEIAVGAKTPLERSVKESRNSYKKVMIAEETIDGVKVDGIETNLVVMKELLSPFTEIAKWLISLAYWEDPLKSMAFCMLCTCVICWGWLSYAFALTFIFMAVFMVLTQCFSRGRPVAELKVMVPPAMNTMEQLLALQNAISQAEELIQDVNIVLLKLRALQFSLFPQASQKSAVALLIIGLIMIFVPVM